MSKRHEPSHKASYGFKFIKSVDNTLEYISNPLNPTVTPCAFFGHDVHYSKIYNCVLYNPHDPTKTLFSILKVHFKAELTGDVGRKYRENLHLPLYYIKLDGSKQLLYKLKIQDFFESTITAEDGINRTVLRFPRFESSPYTSEFDHFKSINQLNCSLIFNKSGFDYLYDIERDTYPNVRVTSPVLSEVIMFV